MWWLSVQGIWRTLPLTQEARLRLLPEEPVDTQAGAAAPGPTEDLLHPKYRLPAHCFAYVGNYADPRTWKLPYLVADGTIDAKRLPKAIQAILSNYRGTKVSGIPEEAVCAVLTRLARAAAQGGHMPPQACNPAAVYKQLADALDQLGLR